MIIKIIFLATFLIASNVVYSGASCQPGSEELRLSNQGLALMRDVSKLTLPAKYPKPKSDIMEDFGWDRRREEPEEAFINWPIVKYLDIKLYRRLKTFWSVPNGKHLAALTCYVGIPKIENDTRIREILFRYVEEVIDRIPGINCDKYADVLATYYFNESIEFRKRMEVVDVFSKCHDIGLVDRFIEAILTDKECNTRNYYKYMEDALATKDVDYDMLHYKKVMTGIQSPEVKIYCPKIVAMGNTILDDNSRCISDKDTFVSRFPLCQNPKEQADHLLKVAAHDLELHPEGELAAKILEIILRDPKISYLKLSLNMLNSEKAKGLSKFKVVKALYELRNSMDPIHYTSSVDDATVDFLFLTSKLQQLEKPDIYASDVLIMKEEDKIKIKAYQDKIVAWWNDNKNLWRDKRDDEYLLPQPPSNAQASR